MTEILNEIKASSKEGKKLAVEKIYQKKTQLEHILLRPDTYVGSVERVEQEMWIWNFDTEKMVKKTIKYVPGLFKIFDEILVNSADNKIRDPNMSVIKININKEQNMIKIYNNGKGIPIVEHKDEKVFVPTLIFGHLLTSSNYDDDEKKVTGGRNGYGAKLCNIFSKKFIVETSCKETKKYFKQTWQENMGKTQEPTIKPNKDEDFTCVTFYPDLSKFGMDELEDDTIALLARRAYDIAASTRGVKVYLNDKRLPISKFEDYCKLYVANNTGESENDLLNIGNNNASKIIYEKPNERWEVAVSYSDIGFQQVSFVNSIATTKGGRHVDYISEQIVKHLMEVINKKSGKNSTHVKPFQIKNHLWLFINCLIENPVFESQTKESMSLQVKNFGSKCQLSDAFNHKIATKSGIVDRVMNWLAFKEKTDLEKGGAKSKVSKVKGIPKLDDANNAGTKDSINCTLILTEGDSAKTLAVAGLGVLGRDRYGVFPLKGKMLNVREATIKQILDNSEITSLCKIIGLNFKEKYETKESMKTLRYGKIMIMTDQDHDGSHIKGLIINFIHHQWPNLLKFGFLEEFITPIIKVFKSKKSNSTGDSEIEKSFYSMPEFEEWQKANPDSWHTWKIKYYKGLGTSTSKEAKEYFSNMNRHCIQFEYSGLRDDLSIQLAFSKRFIEERKDWLTKFMERRVNEIHNNQSSSYLYQKDTKKINFSEFVNKELVLFSNLDNERSIPSLVDGFKPGQRKVLFTCFKRNLQKEIKVAQLAGSVGELSAYHHGEQSLMGTIINLAQNFVGSNNLNLLLPIGQFGTRLHGGKDAASPRYIFTNLNPLTRLLFNSKDDPLYDYINDDGQRVEPEFYCPILPMVLVNGAEGIGTGWAVKIPNYNVKDLVNNLKRLINKEEPFGMKPFYKNFKGNIQYLDDSRFVVNGEIALIEDDKDTKNDYTVEISELPIGTWTQAYKESVLEAYLHAPENKTSDTKFEQLINDYKEYHTDCTVRFIVKMSNKQFSYAMDQGGLHKFFKLQKAISLNNMVLFDSNGCLKRYESPIEILQEFYQVRYKYYVKRKEYLENMLGAESSKLDNIARFIVEKIEGKIKIENLKKHDLIKLLSEKGYLSDPVRKWKEKITQEKGYLHETAGLNIDNASADVDDQDSTKSIDFNYLLSMPLLNLTWEKKEEILKHQRQKLAELKDIQNKTVEQLWLDDLNEFKEEFEKAESKEKEEFESTIKKAIQKTSGSTLGTKKASGSQLKFEYLPAVDGERVEPKIDAQTIAKVEKDAQLKVANKVKKEESLKGLNIIDIIANNKEIDDPELIQQIKELTSGNSSKQKVTKPANTPKKQVKTSENGDTENGIDETINEMSIIDILDTPKKTKANGNEKPKKGSMTSNGTSKKKEKITVDSDSEISFDDEAASFGKLDESLTEKRTSTGRAKKPVKYNINSDDSDNDDDFIVNDKNGNQSPDSSIEDIIEKKKVQTKKIQPKKEVNTDEKSSSKLNEKKASVKKLTTKKDTNTKSPKLDEIDESNKSSNEDEIVESKKTPVKKVPAKKEIKSNGKSLDSDDEKIDEILKKPKNQPKKAAPKKENKSKIVKETLSTSKKSKKVYNSEDDEASDEVESHDDDSDFDIGSAKKAKKNPVKKTNNSNLSNKVKTPTTGKKAASKRKSATFIDDDSDTSKNSIKKTKPKISVYDDDDFSLD